MTIAIIISGSYQCIISIISQSTLVLTILLKTVTCASSLLLFKIIEKVAFTQQESDNRGTCSFDFCNLLMLAARNLQFRACEENLFVIYDSNC